MLWVKVSNSLMVPPSIPHFALLLEMPVMRQATPWHSLRSEAGTPEYVRYFAQQRHRLAYGCRSCCLVEAYGGTHARQLASIVSHYDHTLGQQLPNGVVIMAHYRGRALPMPRHDTPPKF